MCHKLVIRLLTEVSILLPTVCPPSGNRKASKKKIAIMITQQTCQWMLRLHLESNSRSTGCSTCQQCSPFASQRASSHTKAYQPYRRRWTGSLEGYWQLCGSISSILPNQFTDMASQVCIGLACTKKDDTRRNGNGSSKMIWLPQLVIAQSVLLEGVSKLFLLTV